MPRRAAPLRPSCLITGVAPARDSGGTTARPATPGGPASAASTPRAAGGGKEAPEAGPWAGRPAGRSGLARQPACQPWASHRRYPWLTHQPRGWPAPGTRHRLDHSPPLASSARQNGRFCTFRTGPPEAPSARHIGGSGVMEPGPGRAATLGDRPLRPAASSTSWTPLTVPVFVACQVPAMRRRPSGLAARLASHSLQSGSASTPGAGCRPAWSGILAGRPSAGGRWPRLDFRRAYIGVCGNSAERRWNERILGLRITPSRIWIARPMVWSRSQAPGPSITVRRCGISASLISQVAEFHR